MLIADQWLKIYVKLNFTFDWEDRVALTNWLDLRFVENKGMAWGLSFGGDIGKIALSLFRVFASFFILNYIRKLYKREAPIGYIFCIGLIFAGAVGNIFDSLFYGSMFSETTGATVATLFPDGGGYAAPLFGHVVDMFQFTAHWPEWVPYLGGDLVFGPIFNIADFSISTGIISIFVFYRSYFENEFSKKKKEEKSSSDVEEHSENNTQAV